MMQLSTRIDSENDRHTRITIWQDGANIGQVCIETDVKADFLDCLLHYEGHLNRIRALEAENEQHRQWKTKLQKFGSMLLQPGDDGVELIGHRKFRDAFAQLLSEYLRDPSMLMAEGAQEERLQNLESSLIGMSQMLAEADSQIQAQQDELLHLRAQLVGCETIAVDWCHGVGWATGHGDTLVDILREMRSQSEEQLEKLLESKKDSERLAVAKELESQLRGFLGICLMMAHQNDISAIRDLLNDAFCLEIVNGEPFATDRLARQGVDAAHAAEEKTDEDSVG